MNDTDDENKPENPLLYSEPTTYDEAYWTDEQARALYDTYLMLRDAGFDADELVPLAFAIGHTTIYDATTPERLYQHDE